MLLPYSSMTLHSSPSRQLWTSTTGFFLPMPPVNSLSSTRSMMGNDFLLVFTSCTFLFAYSSMLSRSDAGTHTHFESLNSTFSCTNHSTFFSLSVQLKLGICPALLWPNQSMIQNHLHNTSHNRFASLYSFSWLPRSYSLELYYRNESWRNPYYNPVPGCQGLNPCPLFTFTELVRDVMAKKWEVECGLRTKWSSTGEEIKFYILHLLHYQLVMLHHTLLSQCSMFIVNCYFGDQAKEFPQQTSWI